MSCDKIIELCEADLKSLSLADKMKVLEKHYDFSLQPNYPYVIRLDGKGFSKRIKEWKCSTPFDSVFHESMIVAAKMLLEEVGSAQLVWTGSDEISILCFEHTQSTWYASRMSKILSIASSVASVAFNMNMNAFKNNVQYNVFKYPAYFDARVIQFSNVIEACANIISRINDCTRNSILMYASSMYSHKELEKVDSQNKIKMMLAKDFDWYGDNVPLWTKYGECITKHTIEKVVTESMVNDLIKRGVKQEHLLAIGDVIYRTEYKCIENDFKKAREVYEQIAESQRKAYEEFSYDNSYALNILCKA